MEGFVTYDLFFWAEGLVLGLLGVLWAYIQKRFNKSDGFGNDITEIKTDLKWIKDKLDKI